MNLARTTKGLALLIICFSLEILPAFSKVYPVQGFNNAGNILKISIPSDENVLSAHGNATRLALPLTTFKFLVWNLHKGSDKTFKSEFLSMAYSRHIIMAQEMYSDERMMEVFKFIPHYYSVMATSFTSGKEATRTGVLTTSPVKPINSRFIRTKNVEPVLNTPKISLISTYPIAFSRKHLTVVNVHAINFVSTQKFKEEIDLIYQSIKNVPKPLVLSGDFNTWNADRLEILREYALKLGLTEAEFFPDNRLRFRGNPLDHFYFSDDLRINSAKAEEFYQGSDHKPLLLEVEYSPSLNDEYSLIQ
jgi:endonuclease/exonuclease/phosphatase (EEP) superfamily protein YafD